MELFDSNQDFSQVEDRVVHSQTQMLLDLFQELPAWQILEQQVEALIILHGLFYFDEETAIQVNRDVLTLGGAQVTHYVSLVHYVLYMLLSSNPLLLDLLKSEELARKFMLDQTNLAKASPA